MWFKSNFTIPTIAAISFCLISGTTPAVADVLHVPGDYPTIQAAIDAAMNGDEVEVHPGTYNETINFLGKAITVRSSDGPEVTIIDAQQQGTAVSCINEEESDTILEGFTITGSSEYGGMRNSASSPTVTNCSFSGNSAIHGGGMYNTSGSSPTVANCSFSGNSASNGGGMANTSGSSPTVTNCSFSGNSAGNGGGMSNTSGSCPTVANCMFIGNSADFGGGMMNFNDSSPTVTDCTFSNNEAITGGGGMFNFYSSPTLTDCNFSDNSANSGGGMRNQDHSRPQITNCKFTGNTGINGGGGMRNIVFSSPTLTNCIFSGNSTEFDGGGMWNGPGSTVITNCTFTENSADSVGGGIYNHDGNHTVTNCIVWDNSPNNQIFDNDAVTVVSYSDVQFGRPGTGNIDTDPLFVSAENGNFRLSPGSLCIDAADNTAVPKGIDTDLDGNPRFVDDPDTKDTGFGDPPIVDMGAYEFQVMDCPWDVNGDGVVDRRDLVEVVHNLGLCDDPDNCPWDVNGDGIVNGWDVAAVATHFGPCL